jgi:putative ABC transport system ATP-binding protein
MALFQELNDAGMTILIVTHEHDIAQHARRIIELRDGRIIRDAAVADRRLATSAPMGVG